MRGKIEPDYIELDDWPVRPIICDNNILAASDRLFESVVTKLKGMRNVDFNQGLDARLMTPDKARMIASLDMKVLRLAWDHTGIEKQWRAAFEMLRSAGISARSIQSYVLIGYNDTPEDALYSLETIRKLGARPNPQRYQPLTALTRNSYVAPGWTERKLRDYMRYWSRLRWLEHIPFAEYAQY